jgi:hypothetical protein
MKVGNNLDFAGAARAVNLLDPASAQDAATKAFAEGLLGWKDLATVTLGAVNSIDFAPIDQSYADLRLVFEGVSHSSGSSQQCTLAVSPDGSTFSAGANMGGNFPASGAAYGSYELHGYRSDGGALLGYVANLASSPSLAGTTPTNLAWRSTGGIQGLRVALTGGATFDAGRIKLQARR